MEADEEKMTTGFFHVGHPGLLREGDQPHDDVLEVFTNGYAGIHGMQRLNTKKGMPLGIPSS
jgi:hypothetical protein